LARRADGLNLSCVVGKVLKAVSLFLLQSSKDKHWNGQLLSYKSLATCFPEARHGIRMLQKLRVDARHLFTISVT